MRWTIRNKIKMIVIALIMSVIGLGNTTSVSNAIQDRFEAAKSDPGSVSGKVALFFEGVKAEVSQGLDQANTNSEYGELYPVTVASITDGDTVDIILNGKTERIRLLEVDTFEVRNSRSMTNDMKQFHMTSDELKVLGDIGSKTTKYLIPVGSTVYLSFPDNKPSRGSYGRLLAFIHTSDGRVLNEVLIGSGAALVYPKWSKIHGKYLSLQRQAKVRRNGVWDNDKVRAYAD